jgi:hypothetical protein
MCKGAAASAFALLHRSDYLLADENLLEAELTGWGKIECRIVGLTPLDFIRSGILLETTSQSRGSYALALPMLSTQPKSAALSQCQTEDRPSLASSGQ